MEDSVHRLIEAATMPEFKFLRAVVFDWAGTVVDHGCMAPAIVFREVFARRNVPVTIAQAREPMGMAKRAHIEAVAGNPQVAALWEKAHGVGCTQDDIDQMYDDFIPLQKEVLLDHSVLIEGAAQTAAECRAGGLRIGSTTGYTRSLMEVVCPRAEDQGFSPDSVLCADDTPTGRPAPWLLFRTAELLDVYPMSSIVKVDDTPVGIEAGRNAGCWTVGISRTGNGVGLSEEDVARTPADEVARRIETATEKLNAAGAHYILESVSDLMPLLHQLDHALARGEAPTQ